MDTCRETELTEAEAEAILLGLSPPLAWTTNAYPTAYGTLFADVAWTEAGHYEVTSVSFFSARFKHIYCPWLPPLWKATFFPRQAPEGKVRGTRDRHLPYRRQVAARAACERHHSAGKWIPPICRLSKVQVALTWVKAVALFLVAAYCLYRFLRTPSSFGGRGGTEMWLLIAALGLATAGVATLEHIKKVTKRAGRTSGASNTAL